MLLVSKIGQNSFKMEVITEEVVICTTIIAACNVLETERKKNARKRRKRAVWVKDWLPGAKKEPTTSF